MIINDRENNIKAIYIKIPKTGGTTISSNIWRKYKISDRGTPKFKPNRDGIEHDIVLNLNVSKRNLSKIIDKNGWHKGLGWHVSYSEIEKYLNNINEPIEEYTKFSVIREPVSRFISQYRFISPSKSIKSIDYYFDCISNNDERLTKRDIMFGRKQTYWLNNENGLVPEDMKLFTTKKLDDKKTIDYLSDITKFKFNTRSRINVTKKGKKITISSELRSKIENYFSEDCELYEKTKNSLK
jgi:hypothetical protein